MKNATCVKILLLVFIFTVLLVVPACRASFEVTSITVSPSMVVSGNTVFVISSVRNSGNRDGIYDAVLLVNGSEADRQQVWVPSGGSQSVTFTLVEDKTGTYQVSVGGLKSSFAVVDALPQVSPSPVAGTPIPAGYQAMYTTLDSALNLYSTYIKAQSNAGNNPIIFGAELLPANSNRGPELLQPQTLAGVKTYLDRLQEMGVQGVTIPIHYPLYSPNFPRYSEYVSFYQQVVQEIRKRGMKLDIESHVIFANTAFSPIKFNFSNLSFDQYKAGRRQVIESVLKDLHPDYLNIGAEPDTEAKLSSYAELSDPQKYADYLNYLVGGLEKGNTKIAAGIGTWGNLAYLRGFVGNRNIDAVSLHIYPVVGDTLQKTVQIINLAQQYQKRLILDEAWLYKVDSLTATDMASNADIFGRDVYSFWAPLDQKFLSTVVSLARLRGIEYVSPFWSQFFIAYLDFDPANAYLSYAETVAQENTLAAKNIAQDKFSSTGQYYRQLIQQNR